MRSDSSGPGSDVELLALIVRGDAAAFAEFFRRHRGDVYRFALHMTASRAVADDVTQDTFMAVMRDAGRYEAGRAAVPAWLCGIARNFVRRRLARERPFQPLEDAADGADLIDGDADPLGDLARAERVETVRRAVLGLPVRYRETVVLCDLQELSYADAAAALGCAIGTVRSRLHRGRALLAATLGVAADPDARSAADEDRGRRFNRGDRRGEAANEQSPRVIKLMRAVSSARNPA